MEKAAHKATIKDIARALDITPSTVSRALNGHQAISSKTKAAVDRIAKRLNYHPNKIASSLRLGKSKILGVIIPSAEINFFGSVVHGVEKVASKHDYNVLLFQSNELAADEQKGIATFLRSRVDGVLASIAKGTTSFDHFNEIIQRGVPLVLFDRVNDNIPVPSVVIDDFKGAYDATTHLIQQGCKKIIHISGPAHIPIFNLRIQGYKKALQDSGIRFKPSWLAQGEVSIQSGYRCMKELLSKKINPDGVFGVEDFTALGAMQALKEAGKSMPAEVAVIGFANEAFGQYITPGLSTVDQQTISMGEKAARLFFDLSKDGNFYKRKPLKMVLNPVLIYRNSSLRVPIAT